MKVTGDETDFAMATPFTKSHHPAVSVVIMVGTRDR
jgi:hypothetical protein